jgi:hypothetical protein
MHEELNRLMVELEGNAVKSTLLLCNECDEESSPVETKIGGLNYYLPTNKKWPVNEATEALMTPVLQLNLEDFPDFPQKEKKGIFQLFIDFDYKIKDVVITKNTAGVEFRYFPEPAENKSKKVEVDTDKLYFAGPFEIEKKDFLSLPSVHSKYDLPEEHLFMKWKWDKELPSGERVWSIYNYTEGLYIEDSIVSRFGGYAPWLNFDQTPICPVCGNRMAFIAAVGTEDSNFDIGDEGYIMLFSCSYTTKCGSLTNPSVIIQTY